MVLHIVDNVYEILGVKKDWCYSHDVVFAAQSVSELFTLGWMCPLKREQARRERESELRLVTSL